MATSRPARPSGCATRAARASLSRSSSTRPPSRTFETLSYHENAEGYWLLTADVIWFWDNYLWAADRARRGPYACPATAADLRGLPPAVVITAGFDPLRDEGEVYAIKLPPPASRSWPAASPA